ncbi:hypothetical protein RJ641_023657, partial [Dillenia turbinata]
MDLVQVDNDCVCENETSADQLLPPNSPDADDLFGDPLVQPRVGDEFQVEIPPMITESEWLMFRKNPVDEDAVFNVSHSFLVGLPIPVMWVDHEEIVAENIGTGFAGRPLGALASNGTVGSKSIKRNQTISFKRDSKLKCEQPDVNLNYEKDRESLNGTVTLAGKVTSDMVCKHETHRPVPGMLGESWSNFEIDCFLLGLYIFGKNLIQARKFMESKEMGEILSFYYGDFYRSDRYRRWSDCRKMRSRKCIVGQRIFTGWRQQELLSRLFTHVSEELRNTILEDSKNFALGRTSLEEYVSALKKTVGVKALIEAIAIGKGKEDLTGLAIEPVKTSQVFSVRPEIPVGKACSALTSAEIIKFLTGDFRLSKARSNDLFWEAVWPRLLARGWHSYQPKNQGYVASKTYLVFLMPGVKKFSRRKLVKGDHYFDSVSDVLSKVASEPSLLELEAEEVKGSGCKEGNGSDAEEKSNWDNQTDRQRHCYLKPRAPSCSPNHIKLTIVDTSLACGEKASKVRELRTIPIEANITCGESVSRETEESSSEESLDELDSVDLSSTRQKDSNNSKPSEGVQMLIDRQEQVEKSVANHQNHSVDMSEEKHLMTPIKHQFSRRMKSGRSNYLAPVTKRRRLTACSKAETNNRMGKFSAGPDLKEEESRCISNSTNASEHGFSQVGPPQDKASSVTSLAGDNPEEYSESIPNEKCSNRDSLGKNSENPRSHALIDLNMPQVPLDPESSDAFVTGMDSHGDLTANGSCPPSNESKLVTEFELPKTSLNVSSTKQRPVINPTRQSTRNRPLTTKALEALANGFLSTKRKRRDPDGQTQDRPRSRASQRAHGRVTAFSNSGSTDTGIADSKEEKEVQRICTADEDAIGKSPIRPETRMAHNLDEIPKVASQAEVSISKDDHLHRIRHFSGTEESWVHTK